MVECSISFYWGVTIDACNRLMKDGGPLGLIEILVGGCENLGFLEKPVLLLATTKKAFGSPMSFLCALGKLL